MPSAIHDSQNDPCYRPSELLSANLKAEELARPIQQAYSREFLPGHIIACVQVTPRLQVQKGHWPMSTVNASTRAKVLVRA